MKKHLLLEVCPNREIPDVLFHGVCHSPFGNCFLVTDGAGCVFHLSFCDGSIIEEIVQLLQKFPGAVFEELSIDDVRQSIEKIFSGECMTIAVKGTPFEVDVWNALLEIPRGVTSSYEELASMIGKPRAVRAVASAVAKNSIAYLIPCHRVIRKSGVLGEYRWGAERKRLLIDHEKNA